MGRRNFVGSVVEDFSPTSLSPQTLSIASPRPLLPLDRLPLHIWIAPPPDHRSSTTSSLSRSAYLLHQPDQICLPPPPPPFSSTDPTRSASLHRLFTAPSTSAIRPNQSSAAPPSTATRRHGDRRSSHRGNPIRPVLRCSSKHGDRHSSHRGYPILPEFCCSSQHGDSCSSQHRNCCCSQHDNTIRPELRLLAVLLLLPLPLWSSTSSS